MENKNEMVVTEIEKGEMISSDSKRCYYSVIAETTKEKAKIYNAVNNPDFKVSEFINKKIEIAHVLIEDVELEQEKTGETVIVPRTVFVDSKGKSYCAVSIGIFNSIKRIINMFGEPSCWEEPITVEVKQITKGENKILTLSIVE